MSDKFLSKSATGYVTPTTQSTTTCMTATVALKIGMKTSATGSNPNSCNQNNCGWGDGVTLDATIPQFKVTAKVVSPSTSSVTTSTVVAFPDNQDATQYATWDGSKTNAPGDLYVEGTGITSKLSLVAQNDVVVSGPLTTTKTTTTNTVGENAWASGGAVSLVAKNNVRLYHPVSCADTASTATTPGYCPNDITGLYSTGLESNGTLDPAHPAMQYCNLTTGHSANAGNTTNCPTVIATGTGAVTDVNAAVFALNGSLMSDNYKPWCADAKRERQSDHDHGPRRYLPTPSGRHRAAMGRPGGRHHAGLVRLHPAEHVPRYGQRGAALRSRTEKRQEQSVVEHRLGLGRIMSAAPLSVLSARRRSPSCLR